ncbi:MAG: trypsin-like peptidase domain-containing protein [Gemmataceae bacterium]
MIRFLPVPRRLLPALAVLAALASLASVRADEPALPKAFAKGTPETIEDLKEIQAHVKDVVKKVTPAVVGLQIGGASGSGVIIDKAGHILTAGHVSGEPGRPATIILPDGRRLKGKTLGANRGIDSGMVLITLEEKDKIDLPTAEMAKSNDLKRGEWCLAIGHPGGYQKGRTPVVRLGRILDNSKTFIRTDCTLVGGDSGGPLFDMYGRVIGIHSRIGPTITANVHVPIDTYKETFERLAKGESWGGGLFGGAPAGGAYLGLKLDKEGRGCRVENVTDGSPAAKAGLKADDVVTMVAGHRVASADDLVRQVATLTPGAEVDIKVQRGEETLTIRVKLGRRGG